MLTQEILKQYVNYNPETGIFTWIKCSSNRAKIGKTMGNKSVYGYIETKFLNTRYLIHRLAWLYVYGELPEKFIDHINGDRSDNRIKNLRLASQSENSKNQKISKLNTVGLKGVYFYKRDKIYVAQITVNYQNIYLGRYKNAEDAHKAYCEASKKYHGEFGRLE